MLIARNQNAIIRYFSSSSNLVLGNCMFLGGSFHSFSIYVAFFSRIARINLIEVCVCMLMYADVWLS